LGRIRGESREVVDLGVEEWVKADAAQ